MKKYQTHGTFLDSRATDVSVVMLSYFGNDNGCSSVDARNIYIHSFAVYNAVVGLNTPSPPIMFYKIDQNQTFLLLLLFFGFDCLTNYGGGGGGKFQHRHCATHFFMRNLGRVSILKVS